jgi:hypothetical protein
MFTDSLNINARGKRTFRPDTVNVKQIIPLGRAIYYLNVTVFTYQSI